MERIEEDVSPETAASALRWWLDAGVDCLVVEEPRDWLRAKPAPLLGLVSSQTANGLQIEGNIAVDQPGSSRVNAREWSGISNIAR